MAKHKTPQDRLKGFDLASFQAILFESDDWPTAIMACQFLDTFLELAICFMFENQPSTTEQAEIFSGYGPLSSFSSKITIAYAFDLINKDMRDDLRALKSIRNEAAHRIKLFSFNDEDIVSICSKLKVVDPIPEAFLETSPVAKETWGKIGFTSSRARFSLSCGTTFMHLYAKMQNHHAKRKLLGIITVFEEAIKKPGAVEKIIEAYDKLGIAHDLRETLLSKKP